MNYTPIHVHTSLGSILDSCLKIEDLVTKAKSLGMKSLSISDHGMLNGALKFYKSCRAAGLSPIIGCEFYVNNDRQRKEPNNKHNYHICLFARNFQAYKSLVRIQGDSIFEGYYFKPRTTNRIILEAGQQRNIVCTSGCIGSELFHLISRGEIKAAEELALRYQEAFGPDNYYLELQIIDNPPQQKEYNNHLIRMGRKFNIPLVLGQDVHYLDKEDWYLQKLMFLIRDKKTIKDENKNNNNNMGGVEDENGDIRDYDPLQNETRSLWLKSVDEIFKCNKKFGYNYEESFLQEILENTNKIAESVNITIPFYDYKFPKHKHAENITSKELLLSRVKEGLKEKIVNGQIDEKDLPIYLERIQKEIDVLTNGPRDISDYFLFIDSMCEFIRKKAKGMVGCGRGSAASSMLLFLFGATLIDPIKNGLIFERFINSARLLTDQGDVDTDCDSASLPKVEAWLKDTYGEKSVAHVASFTRFTPKNCIKDVSRVLAVDSDLKTINNITQTINEDNNDLTDEWNKALKRFKEGTKENIWLKAHTNDVLKWSVKLTGNIRNVGKHASGIVVTPGQLHDHIPLVYLKGEVLTAYTEGVFDRELPEAGVLKIDLLGLATASIINNAINLIKSRHPEFPYDNKTIFSIDRTDKNILNEFAKGNTNNIFQFSGDGMKNLLQGLNVDCFGDIVLANALYRPGSLNAGMHDEAIANKKKGLDKIEYIHPLLEPILKESYGVPAYQESILRIFADVGNFSMIDADLARKTIKMLGKKVKDKDQLEKLDKFLEKFKTGATQKGLNEEQINKLLRYLEAAADYSFNKCLDGNTEILTATRGIQKISNIVSGEEVYCYKDKQLVLTKVKSVYNNGTKITYNIWFDSGALIKATLDHKLMTIDGQLKAIKEIYRNQLNLILFDKDKKQISTKINCIIMDGTFQAFDLEVEDDCHNFLLANGLISSNSHSACYSLNAYVTMYLKHYFPLEFYCAVLNNNLGDINKTKETINEAKRNNISVKFVDINKSQWDFSIVNNEIYCGFGFIKGISKKDIDLLVSLRPFESVYDFIKKTLENKVGKSAIYPFIQTGITNSVHPNGKLIIDAYEQIKKIYGRKKFTWHQAKCIIDSLELDSGILPYSPAELCAYELEHFGFYLNTDIIEIYRKHIKAVGAMPLGDLSIIPKRTFESKRTGEDETYYKYPVYGIIEDTEIKKTKGGKEYRIVYLSSGLNDKPCNLSFKLWGWDIKYLEKFCNTDANTLLKKGSVVCAKLSENSFGYSLQKSEDAENENDISGLSFINLTMLGGQNAENDL